MAEPWLSAEDIATRLGMAKQAVCSWISERSMPVHKPGRHWKSQTSEVDRWVRAGRAATDSRPEAD